MWKIVNKKASSFLCFRSGPCLSPLLEAGEPGSPQCWPGLQAWAVSSGRGGGAMEAEVVCELGLEESCALRRRCSARCLSD